MKRTILMLIFAAWAFPMQLQAQSEVMNDIRAAIKSGSSKELSLYLNDVVELYFYGEMSSYSRTQAEYVLKDFFKENPPRNFIYKHQGSSKDGQLYAIGEYTYDNGTYSILLRIKEFEGKLRIFKIDFIDEQD
ncbi:DUF4783 domain-containing protein [Roseivirga sp. BDSF3-8]|uniref:DUF4783 domain-containing protein n=1 Tax=Roseivirga sp. BDSF3-8 TaxID=3241598 RepID=UPI003531D298